MNIQGSAELTGAVAGAHHHDVMMRWSPTHRAGARLEIRS
jgi:hypothetical protein